jgi:hypothetical protein
VSRGRRDELMPLSANELELVLQQHRAAMMQELAAIVQLNHFRHENRQGRNPRIEERHDYLMDTLFP